MQENEGENHIGNAENKEKLHCSLMSVLGKRKISSIVRMQIGHFIMFIVVERMCVLVNVGTLILTDRT